MSKRQPLRPGELKILIALLEKDLTNGELQKETKLQSNVLSDYLKNLQKTGLIERNIDTRKYSGRVPITVQVLFFHEVLEFVRTQFRKKIKSGNEKAGIIPGPIGWIVMTDKPAQNQYIEKRLRDLKNFNALFTVSQIIEESWKEYYLSTMNKNNPHIMKRLRVIETYKQFLQEIAEQLYPLELPEQNQKLFVELLEDTKKKMLEAYPNVDIPEKMIRLETERRMKKVAERYTNIMMRSSNLKELYATLETFELLTKKFGVPEKGVTQKELQELEKKIKYLKNPRNKKIYEEHLDRLNDAKALIFYPSWGFKGFPEKLRDLIPKN